jgi:hypothetical protein
MLYSHVHSFTYTSIVKAGLRRDAREAVEGQPALDAIEEQCAQITADMAKGFYRSCGFRSE